MNDLYLPCLMNMSAEASGASVLIKKGKVETVIPISSIQSVELKEPTRLTRGNISIHTAQGNSGFFRATNSFAVGFGGEIRLVFMPENTDKARALVKYICEYGKPSEQQKSDADELRKFKELLDDGIITAEEFNAKKKALLGL